MTEIKIVIEKCRVIPVFFSKINYRYTPMHKVVCIFILFSVISFELSAQDKRDYAEELKPAQALLSQGHYKDAYQLYYQSAKINKNPLAEFTMALFYKYGWGRPVNKVIACSWHHKAAESNIPAAQHFYADCLREGFPKKRAPEKAAIWYKRAADNGHIISLCSLAGLYIAGDGVVKDTQHGLALCKQAAATGISEAMLRVAKFHLMEDPKLKNEEEAKYYLLQAAKRKNIKAMVMLAEIHRDGINGKHIDHIKARQLFEFAASLGNEPSYFQTGKLYFYSPKDPLTNALPADALAKSYLWLSAAEKRSVNNEEKKKAKKLLKSVAMQMPVSWEESLDKKLSEHFRRYPATNDKINARAQ